MKNRYRVKLAAISVIDFLKVVKESAIHSYKLRTDLSYRIKYALQGKHYTLKTIIK